MLLKRCYGWPLLIVCLGGCNIVGKPDVVTAVAVEPVIEPIGELSFKRLHKADYNLDDSPTVKSFNTLRSLADYKTELARYSIEVTMNVDFSRSVVLASTLGSQPSGGYVIGVTKIEEFADKARVTVELVSPGDNCITTSAISNPYEFVEIPTVKVLEIIETARTLDCST
ncbi:hypothetical protein AB833_09055 [Chromatiales bacterium (ex Bugula neritina AB1)]|nr:hypothetical protein AB833_09055 [Chromatiales bacterium (ex Bugula neritina AB1)]